MKTTLFLLCMFFCLSSYGQFSDRGHPEHFVGGMIIGGVTSYLVFKKTDKKFKSWAFGTGAAAVAGIIKEVIDNNSNSGKSTGEDFGYTLLGGAVGASIVFPLKSKKKKKKEVAYLF